jgi:transposase InsO family protein
MEQRYQAVLEVQAGVPVVDVARRFGVSRQAVHRWKNRYRFGGLQALADRPKRPRSSPWQVPAEVEALVCEMRRSHPRWGPRRIRAELAKRPEFSDGPFRLPHRSSIYRILVRFDLLTVKPRRRRRSEYKRWQRDAPIELWQVDIVGSCFLTNGRELKVVTGVDDHSRYCVIAAVVPRATARAVCTAFVQALREFGCPQQVLSDNGKQFTGRFGKPRSAEVLFERICRRNGIETILTKPRSPTTTGKVERFHQTLQADCFGAHGAFADVAAAQAAVDAFRAEYNHDRPHQALNDAAPASRFVPVPEQVRGELGLDIPAELLNTLPAPGPVSSEAEERNEADVVEVCEDRQEFLTDDEHWLGGQAIELERTVSSSGNVKVDLAHVVDDGVLVRTLPAPVPPALRRRLHGVRLAGPVRPVPAGPQRVQGRVSSRGVTQVAGQTLRVGFAHRHTLVDIDVHEGEFHVYDQAGDPLALIPRTSGNEVTRTKGYGVRDHPRL